MGRQKSGAAVGVATKGGAGNGFPALSVRQPWADLLVLGEKDVENRSKPIRYRGWLLIQASKTYDQDALNNDVPDAGIEVLRNAGFINGDDHYEYTAGCIIGMVRVVACVTKHKSPYFSGPYGWVVEDAINFDSEIPFTGKVGIFYVPFNLLDGSPAEKRRDELRVGTSG